MRTQSETYRPHGHKGFPCPRCGEYLEFVKVKDGGGIHERKMRITAKHINTECKGAKQRAVAS